VKREPATAKEAIEAAAELLSNWLASSKGQDGSTVRKQILMIDYLDMAVYPARLKELISNASHDAEADAALCIFAAAFIDEDPANMPKPLRSYIANKLRAIGSVKTKSGKRGKHSHANFFRDFAITYVVARFVDRGFSPSRNREQQRPTESACSLTTKALKRARVHMSEEAIEKIWRNRTRLSPNVRQFIDQGKEDLSHGFLLTRIVGN
jgi:hypothetical protein